MKRQVVDPKTTQRARYQADEKQQVTGPVSPSVELLSVVQAAQMVVCKALALCASQAIPRKGPTAPELQAIPKYVDEGRVAEITGMSRVWLQRARREGIGPRFHKIARRVAYRLDDVVHWIESGAAAREHLSSPHTKKGK